MELIRRAGAHVRRRGFQATVQLVAQASSKQLQACIEALGADASYRQVVQSDVVAAPLKKRYPNYCF